MMKEFKYLAMASILVLMSACSGGGSDDVVEPQPSQPPVSSHDVVSFVPYLRAMTRATDTSFDKSDRIGVFAVESSGSDNSGVIASSGNYAENVAYSYDGSRFVPVATGIELKENTKYYYTAVYPYQQNCKNIFDFNVKADQVSGINYMLSDLCTASTNATGEKVVDLQFNHRLSRVVLNLTGDGWNSSDISVKLKNVMTRTTVDLNNLTFVANGSKTDIACAANGTLSFKAIVPPQTLAQSEKLFVITMNGVDYTLETQSQQDFRSGKSYEYTINMNVNHEIVEFTGDINPWNVDERINSVVPEEIQEKMGPYITIYKGNTPPNVEGTIFVDPFTTVYCEDYGNGGYAPGHVVKSQYIRFSNQNSIYNTLDIDETTDDGSTTNTGTGAFISGTGDNFTAFFNTEGQTNGISTKTALVISGTKSSNGILNLKYAFVMVEKGSDPNNQLMKEGVFRVFADQDAISNYVSWPGSNARSVMFGTEEDKSFSIFSNAE